MHMQSSCNGNICIQNWESSVTRLSSRTNTDPHCLPSLRSICPLKISDHYKENKKAQTALAPYLNLHAEHIKMLCRGAQEIAQIELTIAMEGLQEQLVKFLGILLIDQLAKMEDEWSVTLTKCINLVSECAVLRILEQDFMYLPFQQPSDAVTAHETSLLTTTRKMTEADKGIQAELARPATQIFNASSSHLFQNHIKTTQEHKLQAKLQALNTCQAQNQANLDVEMALEKASEQQLQTNDLIYKVVKKRMKPILTKLQSLEA